MKMSENIYQEPTTEDWARNRKAIAVIKYGETYMKTLKDGSSEHLIVNDQPIILSMRDFVGSVENKTANFKYLIFESDDATYEIDKEDLTFYEQKAIKLID
mgnify:CR=1 FL=1